jgi:NADPH-dependent 2,4-dienoyl-CoA reductase/sulfur reductase-like enzyme
MTSGESLETQLAVVGLGPAGIAAAVRAHESGLSVIAIDDNPKPGGQIWRGQGGTIIDHQAADWLARYRAAKVQTISSAQVISADARSRVLRVETSENVCEIQYEKLILATGAREVFLPFPGWTLPGVMGVGGLQALSKSGLPVARKRIVIAGSGPLLLAVAAYLKKRGAEVALIAEQAPHRRILKFAMRMLGHPDKFKQALSLKLALASVSYRTGCWIERADGDGRLRSVQVRQGSRSWTERCDYAGIAYGLYPNMELAALLGCKTRGSAVEVDESQQSSVEGVYCAGELTAIGGVDLSLLEGEIAGLAASGHFSACADLLRQRESARRFASALHETFSLDRRLKRLPEPETFVCRCEDVTYNQLKDFPSFRAAKLHTRCGMGPCQGRICGAATEFLFGWQNESIRPPILAARVESLVADSGEGL